MKNRLYFSSFSTKLGPVWIYTALDGTLAAISLGNNWHEAAASRLCRRFGGAELAAEPAPSPAAREALSQLEEYLDGARRQFQLPLTLRGTEFEQTVWRRLQQIPYGETLTYGQLALDCGFPKGAARAVGSAVGSNPFAIVIPCHRVVPASGRLGNYSAGDGVATKKELLRLENARLPLGRNLEDL